VEHRSAAALPPQAIDNLVEVMEVELPDCPWLVPWTSIESLDDGSVRLRTPEAFLVFSHPTLIGALLSLIPMLDGTRGHADIVPADVVENREASEIVLRILAANGLIIESPRDVDTPQIRALGHVSSQPLRLQTTLERARVILIADDELGDEVASALSGLGVTKIRRIMLSRFKSADLVDELGTWSGSGLLITASEARSRQVLRDVNQLILATPIRWLLMEAAGVLTRVGPTVIPAQTGCFICYETRSSCAEDAFADDTAGDPGILKPLISIAAHQVALETMRILTGFAPPATIGGFYELTARRINGQRHDILRVPRCAACGPSRPRRPLWENA
jgi:bacteriocin biosynthesis cyclodehydratase domain-containing protein